MVTFAIFLSSLLPCQLFYTYVYSIPYRTDLVEVCRHLGYDDDYADDIMAQIGQDGFISYEAFAQFNRALLSNDVSVV